MIVGLVAGPATIARAQDSDGSASLGPTFLPADTVAYVEFRGDLPDDQADALTAVIQRFPDFADATSVETVVDAALEELIGEATGELISWTDDVRSWLSGEVAGGIVGGWTPIIAGRDPSILAGIEVTDAEAASSFIELATQMVGLPGDMLESEQFAGTTIASLPDGSVAYALTDGLLLVGTGADEIRIGLDVLAGATPSLASAPGFSTAMARIPDGRLAAGYVETASLGPILGTLMQIQSGIDVGPLLDQVPVDISMYAAVRPDGALVQVFVTPGAGTPMLPAGEPHLAEVFPAGTQVFIEMADVGPAMTTAAASLTDLVFVEALRMAGRELEPSDLAALQLLASTYGRLIGWIDDVAIGGGFTGGEVWAGAVITVTDGGAAGVYLGIVEGVLGLTALGLAIQEAQLEQVGEAPEMTMEVELTAIGDVEVVTLAFDLGDTDVPFLDPSLSIAQTEDRVLLGSTSFVTAALTLEPDESLAGDPRYVEAVEATAPVSAGHIYVDIAGIREPLEPILFLTTPEYGEVDEYVAPFDRTALGFGITDDGVFATTMTLLLE